MVKVEDHKPMRIGDDRLKMACWVGGEACVPAQGWVARICWGFHMMYCETKPLPVWWWSCYHNNNRNYWWKTAGGDLWMQQLLRSNCYAKLSACAFVRGVFNVRNVCVFFSLVFASFQACLSSLRSDLFGCIRICSEASRCIQMYSATLDVHFFRWGGAPKKLFFERPVVFLSY